MSFLGVECHSRLPTCQQVGGDATHLKPVFVSCLSVVEKSHRLVDEVEHLNAGVLDTGLAYNVFHERNAP